MKFVLSFLPQIEIRATPATASRVPPKTMSELTLSVNVSPFESIQNCFLGQNKVGL